MANNRVTAMMTDDCLHDPVLGAKVILGYEVPPHMELRLWAMWTRAFMVDSSGFGTAKSLCIAIIAALRAVLMEGRVCGICSRTFPQGQLVHQYFDHWVDTSALFKAQVRIGASGKVMNLHGSSAWQVTFANGSLIRTIAPDFKGDAERAGSEDWHDGSFDEWTKYPNLRAFERQLLTRARKPVLPPYDGDDPIFQNHTYMAGTPKFTWHPCYPRVKNYGQKVKDGSRDHELQGWNYKHIPPEYHKFIRLNLILDMFENLPRDLAEQEVMGRWTKDSLGFYSFEDIHAARLKSCPVLTGSGRGL